MDKKELLKMEEEEHREFHRRLIYTVVVILIFLFGGATFYYYIEKWRYLDAVYFSAYTMTTVGYGDLVPKTDTGKIFTIFYVFAGVGIALYGLSLLASHFVEVREEFWLERIGRLRVRHHTQTFWSILKRLFNFEPQILTKEYEKTLKKKKL